MSAISTETRILLGIYELVIANIGIDSIVDEDGGDRDDIGDEIKCLLDSEEWRDLKRLLRRRKLIPGKASVCR